MLIHVLSQLFLADTELRSPFPCSPSWSHPEHLGDLFSPGTSPLQHTPSFPTGTSLTSLQPHLSCGTSDSSQRNFSASKDLWDVIGPTQIIQSPYLMVLTLNYITQVPLPSKGIHKF